MRTRVTLGPASLSGSGYGEWLLALACAMAAAPGVAPFLCSHLNGQWTDALLQLPMF